MRKSGVLLPVSSLPSRFGIGSFSREAYEFVDFLEEAGQKLWQLLPLGPTGYGDSPYQSFSTFAGNPYFIDLEELIGKGWLTEEECEAADWGGSLSYVDYEKMYESRFVLLRRAYRSSGIGQDRDFAEFCRENGWWLDDYALYMAIKESQGGVSFLEWDEPLKRREPAALLRCRSELAEEIGFWQFTQYLFAKQWQALKAYANGRGIEIVGDIPIYVALDSADTWAHPELFCLDGDCVPRAVAGVPPDLFSDTGQLWGNPLYDWEYHKKTGFEWWIRRIGYSYRLYDIVRVDHFRGFEAYFAIPYGEETAVNGHWEKGPDYELFSALKKKLGKKPMIAEDLGVITPPVRRMIRRCGYPGMKVLQFAFDSKDSEYLPHNYDKNCIVYTGTHDNQTTAGWYQECGRSVQRSIREYLRVRSGSDVPRAMIEAAYASVADTAVIPVQDWLGLGSEARINFPSTLGDNWKWRLTKGQLTAELAGQMRELARIYCR
ncbi:MAG: 4-alpha-glucanotransferase [Eubacteriales bacterium]|nr:4-alpha-glucanotransferase [Eubacteriales bacterium]